MSDPIGALLEWRPAPAGAPRAPASSLLSSVLVSCSVCILVGVVSLLAPVAGASDSAWATGAKLLLFCHLG